MPLRLTSSSASLAARAGGTLPADAMFRTFFDQATNFAAILDLEGRILEINRVSLELGGYARAEVIGLPLWECRWWDHSNDLAASARAAMLAAAGGETVRRVLSYRALDGSERYAEVVVAPVRNEEGAILFLAATGVDVTERRRVTERLRLLDEIGEATRIALEPKAIMAEATRLLGQHLGVTRVAYADLEPDSDRFTIRHDWHEEGVTSTVGTYSLDLFGSRATSNLRVPAGHTVGVAYDGEQAVRLAAQFRPQLAFLDIGMPRLDGYGAARAIRALPGLEAVRLVALTGWGAEEDRQRARAAGFDEHMLKPALPEQVQAVLGCAVRH